MLPQVPVALQVLFAMPRGSWLRSALCPGRAGAVTATRAGERTRAGGSGFARVPRQTKLVRGPPVRARDAELGATGVEKVVEHGASVDVHGVRHSPAALLDTASVAFRHSTPTLLGAAGVAARGAQKGSSIRRARSP